MSSRSDTKLEAVTAERAAAQLGKAPSTIRYWVTHYNARRLGKVGRKMYYDLADLAVIEREVRHEHPVPATWQERAEISQRCPLRAAERLAAAA
jgi:transposase-like protein